MSPFGSRYPSAPVVLAPARPGLPSRFLAASQLTGLPDYQHRAPAQPGQPALPSPTPAPPAAGQGRRPRPRFGAPQRGHPCPHQSDLPETDRFRAWPGRLRVGPVNRHGSLPSRRLLPAGMPRTPPSRLGDVQRWRGLVRPVRPRLSRLHPRTRGSQGQGPLMIHVERSWENCSLIHVKRSGREKWPLLGHAHPPRKVFRTQRFLTEDLEAAEGLFEAACRAQAQRGQTPLRPA